MLHTSTSHGPAYSKKYPPRFEVFRPVCTKVELNKCAKDELYNAYDNTIVYTDYILHAVIDTLKEIKDYKSTMIFISDHGESLGETPLTENKTPILTLDVWEHAYYIDDDRSEERRVGKECRSRWSPYH